MQETELEMRNLLRAPRWSLRLLLLSTVLLLFAAAPRSLAIADSVGTLQLNGSLKNQFNPAAGFRAKPRLPRLSISNQSVAEEAGTAVFVLRLSSRSAKPVTVHYATADITAIAGIDYLRAAGTVTFKRGERAKRIPVTVVDDATAEDDETFVVALSRPKNARLAVYQGLTKILASDLPAAFTATAALAGSGSSAAAHGSATLTFDAATASASFTITLVDAPEDPGAAHIHSTTTTFVKIYPPLPPKSGTASGVVTVPPKVIIDIHENPAAYYVEIHLVTRNGMLPAISGSLTIVG